MSRHLGKERMPLTDLSAKVTAPVRRIVRDLLRGFSRETWSQTVVILAVDGPSAYSRTEYVAALRKTDGAQLANDVEARPVPEGSVLVYVEGHDGVGVAVIDVGDSNEH